MNVVNELITKQGRNDFNIQMDSTYENVLIFFSSKYQEDNLIDFVRLLVKCDIDINCKNKNGKNSLHILCYYYKKRDLLDIIRL